MLEVRHRATCAGSMVCIYDNDKYSIVFPALEPSSCCPFNVVFTHQNTSEHRT